MAVDNATIQKVIGPVTAYAIAVAGGYQGTQQQWEAEIANASSNASAANTNALKAEGYAIGMQNGVEVSDSSSIFFENNAKYWALLAAAATGKYPKVENGYWYVWDVQNEQWASTGVKATGADGDDGVSPTVTITSITGGHRITVTDADGDHTFDVMDGTTPTVPVTDVQVNGTSILSSGVANVPVATKPLLPNVPGAFGVMRIGNLGVTTYNDTLCMDTPTDAMLKQGTTRDRAVTVSCQDRATFYGLAKAAGDSTQSSSSNAVGTYTDGAIDKIMTMLGIDALIAKHEGATASESKTAGDVFIYNGKLYKATSSISSGAAIVPGTNCTQTTIIDILKGA